MNEGINIILNEYNHQQEYQEEDEDISFFIILFLVCLSFKCWLVVLVVESVNVFEVCVNDDDDDDDVFEK